MNIEPIRGFVLEQNREMLVLVENKTAGLQFFLLCYYDALTGTIREEEHRQSMSFSLRDGEWREAGRNSAAVIRGAMYLPPAKHVLDKMHRPEEPDWVALYGKVWGTRYKTMDTWPTRSEGYWVDAPWATGHMLNEASEFNDAYMRSKYKDKRRRDHHHSQERELAQTVVMGLTAMGPLRMAEALVFPTVGLDGTKLEPYHILEQAFCAYREAFYDRRGGLQEYVKRMCVLAYAYARDVLDVDLVAEVESYLREKEEEAERDS